MSSAAKAAVARARVLSGYRRLNRARVQLFQGDTHALEVTRHQLKTEVRNHRMASIDTAEWETLVQGFDEAADMLRHEIVKGKLNDESGRYELKIERHHVQGSAADESIKPEVELITDDMVHRMEHPESIQVCQTSNNQTEKK